MRESQVNRDQDDERDKGRQMVKRSDLIPKSIAKLFHDAVMQAFWVEHLHIGHPGEDTSPTIPASRSCLVLIGTDHRQGRAVS
jgi:hypothetical protein